MERIILDLKCPDCKHEIKVELNTFTAEHKILDSFKPGFENLRAIVEHYKKLKGYDQIPTWDGTNRARAMKAAKSLLYFFRKLQDPVDVIKEYLSDTDAKCKRETWKGWTIEGTIARADEWLLSKMKGGR